MFEGSLFLEAVYTGGGSSCPEAIYARGMEGGGCCSSCLVAAFSAVNVEGIKLERKNR